MIYIIIGSILIIILQVFLSNQNNKWYGLLLPAVCFITSIIMVFNMAVFKDQTMFQIIFQVSLTFILSNIPTVVLLAIYYACREKFRKNKEMDKMNIQDIS